MSQPTPAERTSPASNQSGASAVRLRGRWLLIARILLAVLVAVTLSVFVIDLQLNFTSLEHTCVGSKCAAGQLSPQAAGTLGQLGLSSGGYRTLTLAIRLICALAWFLIAGVLIWRRPYDRFVYIAALQLVLNGSGHPIYAMQASNFILHYGAQLVNVLYMVLLILVLTLFPDGRFVPRWLGWIVLVASLLMVTPVGAAYIFPLMLALGLASQVYRYARVSSPVQQQQAKWVIVSSVMVFVWQLVVNILLVASRSLSQPGSLAPAVIAAVTPVIFVLIPISFVIAILRYRLWDIDTIINRALVYGSLTALLAAIYAGLIIGLESLAQLVTRQASAPIALVVSTLAIAALFMPARRRLQALIDRRFYRSKFDAEKTLAAFSIALQSEFDLQAVRERLLAVVQETIQPAQACLWIRRPELSVTDTIDSPDSHGSPPPE